MKVKFKKLNKNAVIPKFNNSCDAGIDLYAVDMVYIYAGSSSLIKTGIAWEPVNNDTSKKIAMILKSRSGLGFKHGIECTNAGVIDESYRGEIGIKLYNNSKVDYIINTGDRVAQGVIYELPIIETEESSELMDSKRGTNGFGSSGR